MTAERPVPALRVMEPHDVEQVVRVHLEAFPGFFLSFLGPAFLRELYEGIASDSSGIGFVAEAEGEITGFVAGTDQPSGFYRRLIRRRWWRFALASLGGLLRRPAITPRLWRALGMPGRTALYENAALLMSIGVIPGARGSGTGESLVSRFRDEASRRGAAAVVLTTDRAANDTVNAFYRKMGFVVRREFRTPEGREMNEYEIALGGSQVGMR